MNDLIYRVAKEMWEETHTQDRQWMNMRDGDSGETDKYLAMARVAIEIVERTREPAAATS